MCVTQFWPKRYLKKCVTCQIWHVTSDITPDTLHMGVGEHGVNFHVSSCYGLRVKVFKDIWLIAEFL